MSECQNSSMGNATLAQPDDSPGAEMEKQVKFYAMSVGVPLVCAFGIVGNILNLMVLTREKIHQSLTKMEKSAHIGLIALAVSDFMFCLLAFVYTRLQFQPAYRELSMVVYYEWLGPSFITVFIITSTWLTVVMAGERYVAVCHPFKARKLISLRRTRVTILLIYGICFSLTIPLLFEQVVKEEKCVQGGPSVYIYKVDSRPAFSESIIAIRRLVWALLFDFVPCIALLYFNTCLIWKIHKAKRMRRAMAPMQKEGVLLTKHPRELFSYNSNSGEHIQTRSSSASNLTANNTNMVQKCSSATNLTAPRGNNGYNCRTLQGSPSPSSPSRTMGQQRSAQNKNLKARRKHTDSALNSVTATLVAVIVLFLILVSPSEVLKFYYSRTPELTKTHTYKIITYITNLMQAVNFSVNFVLYCAVNKSFRSSLASIFCCCKRRPRFSLPSFDRAYCHTVDYDNSPS